MEYFFVTFLVLFCILLWFLPKDLDMFSLGPVLETMRTPKKGTEVGKTAEALKEFTEKSADGCFEGRVKMDGTSWKARMSEEGVKPEEGDLLRVVGTDGITLICEFKK